MNYSPNRKSKGARGKLSLSPPNTQCDPALKDEEYTQQLGDRFLAS